MGNEEDDKCLIRKPKLVPAPALGRMEGMKFCAERCDYRGSCWSIPASPSCIEKEKVRDIIHMHEVKHW